MSIHELSKDYLKVLLKGFAFLDHCNLFFYDDKMSFRRIFPLFYKIITVAIYYATLSFYMIKIFNGELGFDKTVHVTSVYVICIQSVYRAGVLVFREKDIKRIIEQLGRIWKAANLSEEQIMKKNALLNRLNFRYAVFDWMVYIGAWQYMLVPMLDLLFRKYVLGREYEMSLPFACLYPFDPTRDWFTYSAVYVFQIYSMFHVVYCYVGSETILIALSSHLSTQFSLLQMDLANFKPEINTNDDDEIYRVVNTDQVMRDLIRRHQELISLSNDLDDQFNGIIFMNLTCATVMICFFGLSIIFSKSAFEFLKNFIAIFSGTYPIYNVCFHAELLKEASVEVGDAAYYNPWFEGNKKYRYAIWFIIKRSQKPCYLTSMKYSKIALSTFMTVMSTTWSYFSLASNVYGDKL